MKNRFLPLVLTLCSLQIAHPQETTTPTTAPLPNLAFRENIGRANQFENTQPGVALEYYKRALEEARSDIQKADAQLGIGKTTPFHDKGEADPKNENIARRRAFEIVLALPEASGPQKNKARLELSAMQLNFEQYDLALASVEAVLQDTQGSQPAQRGEASLRAGEALIGLKRYDEARQRLSDFLETKADPQQSALINNTLRTLARRAIAKSYLAQNNPRLAQAEMKKRVTPETKADEATQIYISDGDFFREQKQPALARQSYEMVPTLADATAADNIKAVLQIGASYFDENNYEKARETWNLVPQMRGGTNKSTGEAWHSIGVSHYQEKNYEKAREAFGQWRDVADLPVKVQAWETIATTFLEEKNYEKAREALTNVGKLGDALVSSDDKAQLNLRQQFGIAQIYRAENNFAQAATTYKAILDMVPVAQTDPLYFGQSRNQVKAAADEMAKEAASRDAAYSIYEKWETVFPYEFNKAEANMAMGDILTAQGKKEAAKAKYQKVIELRKTYDDAKIAQQKIDKLAN